MLNYKLLGKSGLRVSELCLGTMSFGTQWGFGADEEESRKVLDAYAAAGGNFLDTANKYHGGETEEIVGRWMQGRRDSVVLATKYTLAMDHDDPNAAGNGRKNLMRAVTASLERLQTDYIDLLWVHAYDGVTPFEETMRGLEDLVRSGRVHHIGISDAPAWIVSASNVLSELRGWSSFIGLQIEYSLLERTVERELIPMARHFDLGVLAWAPLSAGVLTGKYTRDGADNDSKRSAANDSRGRLSERSLTIARAVDEVADDLGVTSAQVATAWVMAQDARRCFPILGARKVSQIEDTLQAAAVQLSAKHLAKLDEVSRVDLGFPHQFLSSDGVQGLLYGENTAARLIKRPASR